KFGKELVVLGWIGAAGDQTPRPMYELFAEYRMVELHQGKSSPKYLNASESVNFRTDSYLEEVGDRIVNAILHTYESVKNDQY
ncbi:MAG: hypothetical protein WDZ72_10975, partial [Cyclobacteriaceae bacterium]